MSTGIWSTKDWGLAQAVAYVTGSLPTATKAQGKSVFHFQEKDRHKDYTFDQLQGIYYSADGMAISNVRLLLEIGRDIRTIALSAKEE